VVNAGNANAFTGSKGRDAVVLTADITAEAVDCDPSEVFLASTGVIGEPLDAGEFKGALADCAGRLVEAPWINPARAILTTDTYPKLAEGHVVLDGHKVEIAGITKGSGMIAPDMATMLGFLFTDAPIAPQVLQALLTRHVQASFNAITVDSDTSTSDTVLAFATGRAASQGMAPISDISDPRAEKFGEALFAVMFDLAMQIVRVSVCGAQSDESAKKIANSIANSPLVKTAIAGEDANWGRVVMAVGKAGEPADRDKISIRFGDLQVAKNGEQVLGYSEEAASLYMQNSEIEINVDLAIGVGQATVFTCDLTHDYIAINADYRS
jgi:glutamate N-acetyltransferase/amino-acid N-acetyltransferase